MNALDKRMADRKKEIDAARHQAHKVLGWGWLAGADVRMEWNGERWVWDDSARDRR